MGLSLRSPEEVCASASLRATKEEKVRKDSRTNREAVPTGDDPEAVDPGRQSPGERQEPEARFAPGPRPSNLEVEGDVRGVTKPPPYEELGQYLRLLVQGKTAGTALGELLPPGEEPTRYWNDLRRAASEYRTWGQGEREGEEDHMEGVDVESEL